MTFGLPDSAVERIRTVLASHQTVQGAVLYGSRAKGTFRPSSDIDLTLIAPTMPWDEFTKMTEELDDLLLPWKIDLSLKHRLNDPALLEHIDRVGQRFWEAS